MPAFECPACGTVVHDPESTTCACGGHLQPIPVALPAPTVTCYRCRRNVSARLVRMVPVCTGHTEHYENRPALGVNIFGPPFNKVVKKHYQDVPLCPQCLEER